MSWMLVIVAALVLANVAVAVRSSGHAPARSRSDDDLQQAVAKQRARESHRRG